MLDQTEINKLLDEFESLKKDIRNKKQAGSLHKRSRFRRKNGT